MKPKLDIDKPKNPKSSGKLEGRYLSTELLETPHLPRSGLFHSHNYAIILVPFPPSPPKIPFPSETAARELKPRLLDN